MILEQIKAAKMSPHEVQNAVQTLAMNQSNYEQLPHSDDISPDEALARALYEEQFRQVRKQSTQQIIQRIPCDGFSQIVLDEIVQQDIGTKMKSTWGKFTKETKDLFKTEKKKGLQELG